MSEEEYKQHHIDMVAGDTAPTVLIPEDVARIHVFADLMDEAWQVAHKREYLTYTGKKDGVLVSYTSTGLGPAPTAIGVEELIRIGTKNIIRIGTCGAIQPFIKPGEMIIATGAIRGERASEEFIPIDYPAIADFRIVRALIEACERLQIPYHKGLVRTHDAFYMEFPWADGDTKERLQKWIDLDVLAVDNESSVVFVIAGMQGIRSGAILLSDYSIYGKPEEDGQVEENINKLVRVGIEAAKILHEKGLD